MRQVLNGLKISEWIKWNRWFALQGNHLSHGVDDAFQEQNPTNIMFLFNKQQAEPSFLDEKSWTIKIKVA